MLYGQAWANRKMVPEKCKKVRTPGEQLAGS